MPTSERTLMGAALQLTALQLVRHPIGKCMLSSGQRRGNINSDLLTLYWLCIDGWILFCANPSLLYCLWASQQLLH